MSDPTPDLTPEQRAELTEVERRIYIWASKRGQEELTLTGNETLRMLVSLAEARRLLRAVVKDTQDPVVLGGGFVVCTLCGSDWVKSGPPNHDADCARAEAERYLENSTPTPKPVPFRTARNEVRG